MSSQLEKCHDSGKPSVVGRLALLLLRFLSAFVDFDLRDGTSCVWCCSEVSGPLEDGGDVLAVEEDDCSDDWAWGAFDGEGLGCQRRTDASLSLYRFILDDPLPDSDEAWLGSPFSLAQGPSIGWTFLGMNLVFMFRWIRCQRLIKADVGLCSLSVLLRLLDNSS